MLRAPQHREHGFQHRILGPCLVAQLQMRQAQQGRARRGDAAAQLLWIDTGLRRGSWRVRGEWTSHLHGV